MTKRVLVLFAGFIFIGRALSAQPSEPATTVTAVLKQYQDTMNKQNGCTFTFSGTSESDAKYPPNISLGKGGHKVSYESGEFVCDGNRFKFRMNQWGHHGDKTTTEGSPYYWSVLWDGKDEYVFFKDPLYKQSPGRLSVFYGKNQKTESSRTKVLGTMFPGRFLVGYFNSTGLRSDELLSKSVNVSLRNNPEQINGAECNVVDVAGRWGRGTIWFSIRHGGLIAKTEFHQQEGDLYSDKPLKAGAVVDFLCHDVTFTEIAGVWFTTGGTEEKKQKFAAGGFENYKRVFKLTQATPNPDPGQVTNYFSLADVAEGSVVGISGKQEQFVWRNGRISGPLDEQIQKTFPLPPAR